jgi:hypothetical protein
MTAGQRRERLFWYREALTADEWNTLANRSGSASTQYGTGARGCVERNKSLFCRVIPDSGHNLSTLEHCAFPAPPEGPLNL